MGNTATILNGTNQPFLVLVFNHSDWLYKYPRDTRVVFPEKYITVSGIAGGGAIKIAVVLCDKARFLPNVHGNALRNEDALLCDFFCINDEGSLTITSISPYDSVFYDNVNERWSEEGKFLYLWKFELEKVIQLVKRIVSTTLEAKSAFGKIKSF